MEILRINIGIIYNSGIDGGTMGDQWGYNSHNSWGPQLTQLEGGDPVRQPSCDDLKWLFTD